MRLLKTDTPGPVIRSFNEQNIPPYAILSHTWLADEDEVTFADISNISETVRNKAGWNKIEHARAQALADGYSYIWVDTCCIDKSSSAELSEAINSMFRWYASAGRCLVYLQDLPDSLDEQPCLPACKWFTRGWTLQELLAPWTLVVFYNKAWKAIGTVYKQRRDDAVTRFECEVAAITGIHLGALRGRKLSEYSIAQRMSWAGKRETTRREDVAYSLMGIFDINMPIMYGESDRAFYRLQEAILRTGFDQTLLLWDQDWSMPSYRTAHALLAPEPRCFQYWKNAIEVGETDYEVTTRGLKIFAAPLMINGSADRTRAVAMLNCRLESQKDCEALSDDCLALNLRQRSKGVFYVDAIGQMTRWRTRLVDQYMAIQHFRPEPIEILFTPGQETLEPVPGKRRVTDTLVAFCIADEFTNDIKLSPASHLESWRGEHRCFSFQKMNQLNIQMVVELDAGVVIDLWVSCREHTRPDSNYSTVDRDIHNNLWDCDLELSRRSQTSSQFGKSVIHGHGSLTQQKVVEATLCMQNGTHELRARMSRPLLGLIQPVLIELGLYQNR